MFFLVNRTARICPPSSSQASYLTIGWTNVTGEDKNQIPGGKTTQIGSKCKSSHAEHGQRSKEPKPNTWLWSGTDASGRTFELGEASHSPSQLLPIGTSERHWAGRNSWTIPCSNRHQKTYPLQIYLICLKPFRLSTPHMFFDNDFHNCIRHGSLILTKERHSCTHQGKELDMIWECFNSPHTLVVWITTEQLVVKPAVQRLQNNKD